MSLTLLDSIANTYFIIQVLLKIGISASNIQGSHLAYLISASFILTLDILISILSIFHLYCLIMHKSEGLNLTLKTFFCFDIFRIIAGVVFLTHSAIFKENQICLNFDDDLCTITDEAQIEYYVSFSIQIAISIPVFIIYCKF